MKERPILFSGPMVRALLAGTKTQTRRVVKLRGWITKHETALDHAHADPGLGAGGYLKVPHRHPDDIKSLWDPKDWTTHRVCCPYGHIGDRLWVRETWNACRPSELAPDDAVGPVCRNNESHVVVYRAGGAEVHASHPEYGRSRWRPSIHMPRWAARITLEITNVRVERLKAITDDDARAEGVPGFEPCGDLGQAVADFRKLWNSINAKRAPWSTNPWVWVVTFRMGTTT